VYGWLLGNVLRVEREESDWIRFALASVSLHPLICDDTSPFDEVIPG